MVNALKPLAESSSISKRRAASHKKMFGSGACSSGLANRTTLIISNKEMNDIMKIITSLGDSGSLINDVS